MKGLQSEVLLEGRAQGPVLRLAADISFWGGVDPDSGRIIDRRHPDFGDTVAGKILAMQRSIGSSSGSSVLLELFRRQRAPSGIVLVEADMVVVLGAVVAREMGFDSIPVVRISEPEFLKLPETASIDLSGKIESYKDSI
jgi:predicted aconitase with swiveling domain